MDVSDLLRDLGGVARRSTLLRLAGRAGRPPTCCRCRTGRQRRPGSVRLARRADVARRIAARLGGALGLTSAAVAHGWAVKALPDRPHVLVSRGRKLSPDARSLAHIHIGDPVRERIGSHVTEPALTLEQCLRQLAYDEALAVADSALRAGFGRRELERIADQARGPGSPQMRAVALRADPRADNPFESTLRAIAHGVPGLEVTPQLVISDGGFVVRPDLVDPRLWVVMEADSFAWQGSRPALVADARRYNGLVVRGWMVLRFAYEDVMFHPADVRDVLVSAVALAELLSQVGRGPLRAA